MAHHKPPQGFATMPELIGLRPVSPAQAAANRERLQAVARLTPAERRSASLRAGPTQERAALPALFPGLAPHDVHAAVQRGDLPPPVCGRWGEAWPIDAVQALAASLRT